MLRKQHWFYGLLLFLISSAAFADSSSGTPSIASDAVSNHTDLSINFLSQLFGTVGNSLSGTSGQMLGKLFYELNVGILVVAGIWLSYTVTTLVFGAATEGGFMSGRNNLMLAFLKIAIGIGALIPSPTTGYSVIQDVVMQVVVKSVAFADMTWSHGLNYLSDGGAVWSPPAAESGGMLTKDSFNAFYTKVIQPTFNAEVCMYKASLQNQQQQNSNGNTYSSSELNPIDNDKGLSFDFPNSKDPSGQAGCGSFKWGAIPGASASGQKTTEGEYAYEAAYKVVYGLLPAAKDYVCSMSSAPAGSICSGMSKQLDFAMDSEVMFNNLLAYVNAIEPLATTGGKGASSDAQKFLNTAEQQGWILAGRYSWDLNHMKDQVITASQLQTYVPPEFAPSDSDNNNAAVPGSSSSNPMDQLTSLVQAKYDNYAQTSNAGGNSGGGFSASTNAKWISPFIASLVNDIKDLQSQFSSHMGSDPIYFLHRVGYLCIAIAGDIWIDLAAVAGMIMLVGIICSGGSVDLDKPIDAAVSWIKPFAMGIAAIFVTIGGMLAFYVPVYSFFIFTFGVISWFILVIEAMVAAPLVAFGMTHPQGHDFLGKVEQSVMLLLGVFLRPVLMVIGLFAAMILSFIAFRMTNFGFASFMSDIFTSSPSVFTASSAPSVLSGMTAYTNNSNGPASIGTLAVVLIGMPVLMLMYATVVVLIVNQCYSLVYRLPDYIMRWIGGPQSDSGIGHMMQEIKGSAEGSSNKLGDAAGKSINETAGGMAKLGVGGVKKAMGNPGETGHSSGGGSTPPAGGA